MLQTLMCYVKVHIKNKILRLNFILFIPFEQLMMWHVDILKTTHLAKSLK
jgi:hypothetical protein